MVLSKVLTIFGLQMDRAAIFSLAEKGRLMLSPLQTEFCLGDLQGKTRKYGEICVCMSFYSYLIIEAGIREKGRGYLRIGGRSCMHGQVLLVGEVDHEKLKRDILYLLSHGPAVEAMAVGAMELLEHGHHRLRLEISS